jgi:AraC-like DNA-binding protein
MDAAGTGRGTGTADPDVPIRAAIQTCDVDEARAFCRQMFYQPLHVRAEGDGEGFTFHGDVVKLGPVTVGEISYGSPIRLRTTDLQTAYHVLAPLTGTVLAQHRGVFAAADPARAVVLQPVGDIDLRWSAGCRLLSIKVDRSVLERELDAALGRQLASPIPIGASFAIGDGPGRTWTALVRLLHAELGDAQGLLSRPQMARRWRDLVVSGLALTVEHPYAQDPVGQPAARRPRTVKRALDAMHAEPGRRFTAVELAAIAGVGIRVLQESFRRHVGVPPLTYLRRLRLDGVHAELSRGDPRQVSVSDVAYRWGFTHMGRFAGAYRERFGVPPSQTLRDRD